MTRLPPKNSIGSSQVREATSGSHWQALVEHCAVMLAVVDGVGHLREANPAWQRALGTPADALESRPLLEWLHPQDRERLQANMRTSVARRDEVSDTYRVRTDSGHYRDLRIHLSRAAEAESMAAGLFVTAFDVSDHRTRPSARSACCSAPTPSPALVAGRWIWPRVHVLEPRSCFTSSTCAATCPPIPTK